MDQIIYDILPNESADNFVRRIPPLTTTGADELYVYKSGRCMEGRDILIDEGNKLLQAHLEQIQCEKRQDKKLELTKQLYEDILNLAKSCNHLEGKWLYFVSNKNLNYYWKVIVKEVLKGNLGTCAKIGLKTEKKDKGRIIRIYTKDFTDLSDISRIFYNLMDITNCANINYKISVFSRLQIKKQNTYGLPLIMYKNYGNRMLKCDEVWLSETTQNMLPPRDGQNYEKPWEMKEFETPEEFVQRMPPSNTTTSNFPRSNGFIWCRSERRNLEGLEKFKREGKDLIDSFSTCISYAEDKDKAEMLKEFKKSIEELAYACEVTEGTWMLLVDNEEIDAKWLQLVKAVKEGRSGVSAKVRMYKQFVQQKKRAMFVSTRDFTDVEDIHRVLKNLKSDGLLSNTNRIYYTPDAFFYLDIYQDNKFNLSTYLCSSDDFA